MDGVGSLAVGGREGGRGGEEGDGKVRCCPGGKARARQRATSGSPALHGQYK